MADSLANWLALREPIDFESRSNDLARAIARAVGDHAIVRVLELGTGTGSNIRYLTERLPRDQHWLVADRDPDLLGRIMAVTSPWAEARNCRLLPLDGGFRIAGERLDCRVDMTRRDLLTLPGSTMFEGRQLVTASALLDLVSEAWLRDLAALCHGVGAAALFALTYDGRCSCTPEEPEDALVQELFNQHQRTDKGLGGRAAGPDAAQLASVCFEEAGYHVRSEPTDWRLGPREVQLQRQLIEGWAFAAEEIAPDAAGIIAPWKARRLAHVDAGRSHIMVGHHDMAAWLPKT